MNIQYLEEERVFRDAIYNYIHINHQVIWKLINTPEFQRLRRIHQLGGIHYVFSSGEHSRFVHSLGVYEVIKEIIETDAISKHLTEEEKLTVLCAGLLHDLGHGPYSHTFESVFHIHHEEMTIQMILGETKVNEVLKTVSLDFPEQVASIINKKHPKPMLIQLLSSQIDADRFDYLQRDSYHCGVTYGYFDRARLIRIMRVKDDKLIYKQSGVQAIEDYILARYHMYWQVYYHDIGISFDYLLINIMKRVQSLYHHDYHFHTDITYLIPFMNNHYSLQDYYYLDDDTIIHYMKGFMNEEDTILKDLSRRFIHRDLYTCTRYSKDAYQSLQSQTKELGYMPDYYLMDNISTKKAYKHYDIDHLSEIEILCDDHILRPLPEVSEIVQAILITKEKKERKIFHIKEVHYEMSDSL